MSAYIPVELQRQIRAHFANRCAYCQTAEELTVSTFEFEHIVPLSKSGSTSFENLCLSCPNCNRYKATRQRAPDPVTQEDVELFHPQNQIWKEHFQWTAHGTEIEGLTPEGRATVEVLKVNRPQMLRVRKMWIKLGEHPPPLG